MQWETGRKERDFLSCMMSVDWEPI